VALRLANNGDFWDLAREDEFSAPVILSLPGDYQWVIFKAKTPFCHFLPDEWSPEVGLANKWVLPYVGPDGTETPPVWRDHRQYIRNNTMRHLVELVYVLRMSPYDETDADKAFRTFNLVDYSYYGSSDVPHDYSEAEDGIRDNFDGTLAQGEGDGGDRNMLDMVRLGAQNVAEKVLIGRININTRRREVLQSLFRRVTHEAYGPGTPIPATQVEIFITNLMARTLAKPMPVGLYQSDRNHPLYGALFDESWLPEASRSGLTRTQKAYLLVLTQELVSAEHNYFTVVAAAQALKDVGAIPPDEITINGIPAQLGRYDVGADRILGEQKIKAVLYRNAFTNKIDVERYEFLDE
jgi:hypothetical protein